MADFVADWYNNDKFAARCYLTDCGIDRLYLS